MKKHVRCKTAGQYPRLLMQLDKSSGDIEILADLRTERTVKLSELVPNWWGVEGMNGGK